MNAPGEHELQAYVDDRLDPERRTEVEDWLAANPDQAARVRDYRDLNQRLHRLYDGVLDEPVPARLLARPRRRRGRAMRVAAALALVLIGGALGWLGRAQFGVSETEPFARRVVDEALLAHAVYTPEVRHPVEVPAGQQAHLVAWLSKRLGADIRAPDLARLGFELLGGRLLAAGDGPAAQFMYQDAGGRRLTLFVRRDGAQDPDTAFRFIRRGAMNAFYWIDRDLGYALIGELDKATLTRIAHSVYQQLGY